MESQQTKQSGETTIQSDCRSCEEPIREIDSRVQDGAPDQRVRWCRCRVLIEHDAQDGPCPACELPDDPEAILKAVGLDAEVTVRPPTLELIHTHRQPRFRWGLGKKGRDGGPLVTYRWPGDEEQGTGYHSMLEMATIPDERR